jgi:hypothetical protein
LRRRGGIFGHSGVDKNERRPCIRSKDRPMTDSAQQFVAPAVGARFHVGADIEKAPIDDTLDELAVRPEQGLSSDEAHRRLTKYRPNALVEKQVSPLGAVRRKIHLSHCADSRGQYCPSNCSAHAGQIIHWPRAPTPGSNGECASCSIGSMTIRPGQWARGAVAGVVGIWLA